jgi:DNA-binding CsgD family transcriptional regulator
MGIAHNDRFVIRSQEQLVTDKLRTLTPQEREICLLHFVDERPQKLIAEWLGINRFTVVEHLESAIRKVPELATLRTLSQGRSPKIKVFHLSQLPSGNSERGPFNIDEL